MNKKYFSLLLIIFLTISCSEKKEEVKIVKRTEPTKAEIELAKTFSREEAVLFEICRTKQGHRIDMLEYCFTNIIEERQKKCYSQAGPSVGQIAVGTALGMGAVKLLFGK